MQETKIQIQDAFKQNLSDGGCSASEPFALRTLDDSMEPEFEAGCISGPSFYSVNRRFRLFL